MEALCSIQPRKWQLANKQHKHTLINIGNHPITQHQISLSTTSILITIKHLMKSPLLQSSTIKPDPYRYKNLLLFSLIAICNSLPIQAFTGVQFIISSIYNQPILVVNINWISYFVLYLIMILPANYLVDQKGLKIATLISQTCMIVGLSVRCLINVSFAYFLFGTLICSIGFCLNVSVANKLAIVWFPQHDIFKVKSFLIFLLIISESLGYFLSTLFITSQSTRQSVLIFFIVQSSIMIIVQILNMLFFKPAPMYTPNYCSLKSVRNFRQNIKLLVPNFDYLLTFFSMSFIFLNTGVFFVGVTQFQKSYGFDQSLMKTSLLIVCLAGALGTFINCRFLITQYKLKCIICYAINLIGYIHLFIAVQTHQTWLINISTFLIGLSTFPIIALLADYGAQCAFPAGQGTSGGSLFFGGYTFGSMVTLLLGVYIGHDQSKQRSRVTLVMFIVFVLLSLTFLALTDERLKRKNYQERKVIRQKIKLEKMQVFEIQDFLIK